MPLATVIRESRDRKGLTQAELADKLGVVRATIISWEKGRSEPDGKELHQLSKILEQNFTNVSRESDIVPGEIPFYDAVAVGGTSMLADQESVTQPTEMIHPGTWFKAATGALRVYGHSMYPKYPAGCIVAFRRSNTDIPSVIVWGEDYVIELEDRRIVKKVDKGDTKTSIKAVSYNGNNADKAGKEKYTFDTIDIELSDIRRMYMVLGKVELEASI